MPGNRIEVYCEDFLTDPKNGDFDTVGIIYCKTGDGKKNIRRYFKEYSNDTRHHSYNGAPIYGWREINFEEYLNRKANAKNLKESKND